MHWVTGLLFLAIPLSAAMAAAWRIAEVSGRSGWIDAVWTFATGAACAAGALSAAPGTGRPFLAAGLAAIWSLRLGLHIVARTMRGGDDPRYRQLREEWGERASLRLFRFLQVQAAVGLVLAVCVAIAARRPGPTPDLRDMIAVALFALALAGEAAADRQLTRFAADPRNRGKVCDTGLWSLSRHPNYFCEWLVWVAFAIMAIAPVALPLSGFALAAPALMYVLLVHVSGIPPLEAHMLRSRGEAFRAYQARVNAFWPGPRAARVSAKGAAS